MLTAKLATQYLAESQASVRAARERATEHPGACWPAWAEAFAGRCLMLKAMIPALRLRERKTGIAEETRS